MKKLALLFALLFFASFAHAAAGPCPAGANYIDLTNPSNGGGMGSVTLASLGVTQCYYISAAGADTNSGGSEASPWLHAPGMPACSSICAGVSPAANLGFIFRGGDTWHRSSGSPQTGGAWTFSHSGTAGNPIYWGIDVTWFSGGSFARPIFNQDNALSTGTVGSCSFADDGTTFLNAGSTSFNIVDGLEFTGNCQSGSGVGSIISPISATSFVSERLYMHGWTSTAGVGDDAGVKIGTNGNSTSNLSNRHLFDVIDGADSTFGASCNTPSCVGSATASGWAFGDAWDVEYSVIRHVSNGIQAGNICTVIGNLMEYEFEPTLPGGRHGNVLEENFGSGCTTMLAYNNVTQNTNEGVNWWPGGGTYYILNNVWINSGHVFGSPAIDPNGLMLSGLGTTGFTTVHANLYNNTFQSNKVQAPAENGTTPGWAAGSTLMWENNHIMDFTNTTSFFTCGASNTCAATENGGEVFQTTTVAEGQGYSFANSWSPTLATNATVGHGNNATSFCSGLPNALAIAACKSGSPQAVSEAAGWGGLMAMYPAITPNLRTPGVWDAGAYQFASAVTTCAQPCTNQNVLPLATPPSVGGLTGVNSCITDPVFQTTVCRVADANEDPSHPNIPWQFSNGGSNDDNAFNSNNTLFVVVNTNGAKKPKSLNTITHQVSPLYASSFPATNGMTIPYPPQFSTVSPSLLYAWNGTQLGTYTFDPPNYVTPPAFTNLFNFVTGGGSTNNCVPSNFGAATWTSDGGVAAQDSFFVSAWSSANYHIGANDFQGTGFWAAAYVPGKGCFAVNTSTGAIVADQGFVGGTGLTCTGTGCTGTTSNSATDLYTIHAIKLSINSTGQMYMLIGRTTCLTVTCSGSGNNPYFQQVGSNVQVYGGDSSRDGGHWAGMAQGFANIPGMPQAYYRTYAAPSVTTAQISPTPGACAGYANLQQHMGATNTNAGDTNPVMVSTGTINLEAPFDGAQCPWWNEVYTIDYNGDGLTHRYAHTNNTGQALNFDALDAIAEISPSGALIGFNSDWLNTLGCTNGATTCTPNGPDWTALRAYPTGYVINPNLNNASGASFRATTGGTSNSSELNWATGCASTCSDGTVSWINLGVPTIAAAYRSDPFVVFGTPDTTAATPTFFPVAGTYTGAQSVALSTTSTGALICWNRTGSPATDDRLGCAPGSTLYTGFLTITGSGTVYATAGGGGYVDSSVGSATYTITNIATTPTPSPIGGTYTTAQSVALSTMAGGVICYVTSGTPATNGTTGCTTGTKYTTPISVSSTETLVFVAGGTGYVDSPVGSAAYIITPASGNTFTITGNGVISGTGSIH